MGKETNKREDKKLLSDNSIVIKDKEYDVDIQR